jgi:glycosyltransferase involved in cell wall biosynthesis
VPSRLVTVAIPVRNGGEMLARTLAAVRSQIVEVEVELLVCDSGSTDASLDHAREYGARVIEIRHAEFGHGTTRNLLLGAASGSHVALLTQDSEPADEHWLAHLLSGFSQADDVALVYGPYIARPSAPPAVRRELERWFNSLTPGVERLGPDELNMPSVELMGRRGFFTDANACISRAAWERVPFRDVVIAEDRALALDMLRAGYAKVYEPSAAAVHSHDYGPRERFGRAFDEWRGLREVYGWREPATPRHLLSQFRGELGPLRREGAGLPALARAARDELVRLSGAVLGSRAQSLPTPLERRFSREGAVGKPPARGSGAPS